MPKSVPLQECLILDMHATLSWERQQYPIYFFSSWFSFGLWKTLGLWALIMQALMHNKLKMTFNDLFLKKKNKNTSIPLSIILNGVFKYCKYSNDKDCFLPPNK